MCPKTNETDTDSEKSNLAAFQARKHTMVWNTQQVKNGNNQCQKTLFLGHEMHDMYASKHTKTSQKCQKSYILKSGIQRRITGIK